MSCRPSLLLLLLLGRVSLAEDGRFHTVSLGPYLEKGFASDLSFQPRGRRLKAGDNITVKDIPFVIDKDEAGNWRGIEVRERQVEKKDRTGGWAVSSALKGDKPINTRAWSRSSLKTGDLVFHLPKAYYCRAYVLAAADGLEGHDPALTLRAGAFQGRAFLADTAVEVPSFHAGKSAGKLDSISGRVVRETGRGKKGQLYLIPIQIRLGDLLRLVEIMGRDTAFGKHKHGRVETLDVQLTQRLHTWVAAPDPYNFRVLPLGAPSGVRVFAVTFERSSLTSAN